MVGLRCRAAIRVVSVVLLAAATGCSMSGETSLSPPDPSGGADGPGNYDPGAPLEPCEASIGFAPAQPIALPQTTLRVFARTGDVEGVLEYQWFAYFEGTPIAFTPAQSDGSQIDIPATRPGVYEVRLNTSSAGRCAAVSVTINVRAPDASAQLMRLRVVPPPAIDAPVFEQLIGVTGGASVDLGIVRVDAGLSASATVIGPGGGIPAYLRFSPRGAPDAIVEAFSDVLGQVNVRLVPGRHDVVVIPSSGGVAPARIEGWTTSAPLLVPGDEVVTGSVHDPAGTPLAGAVVQLKLAGVPSTVATTASDGSFTLRATFTQAVVVEVAPPPASGLPRLTATVPRAAGGIAIRYTPGLVRRNLAGVRVRRDGGAIVGARVTIVGTLDGAGTVGLGGVQVSAAGEVRITATASVSGELPSTLVPAAGLSAVIATGDSFAVTALDTRTGVPDALDAPMPQAVATTLTDAAGAPLPGALIALVPQGALASAAAPTLHATANTGGGVTLSLAGGGHYELRLRDPAGRGAPLVVAGRTASTIAAGYALPRGVAIHGTLSLGGTQPMPGALVQILCDECSGLERARPIAEGVAGDAGRFVLTVQDPGSR